MKWYAGHIVMYLELKHDPQESFMVWENVVLLGAETFDEAMRKAEDQGRREGEHRDDSLTLDGKPARWIFAGVRKVVLCVGVVRWASKT